MSDINLKFLDRWNTFFFLRNFDMKTEPQEQLNHLCIKNTKILYFTD